MGEMDIVAQLRDPEYAGCMQHLRSYDEIDRLFNASADLIETYMADADAHVSRLELVRRQEDEVRDLKAENAALRSDLARIAKERDDAMKALEPFSRYADYYFEGALDNTPIYDDHSDFIASLGAFRRAAAISQMGEKP